MTSSPRSPRCVVGGPVMAPIRLQPPLHRIWALRGVMRKLPGAPWWLSVSISRQRNEGSLALSLLSHPATTAVCHADVPTSLRPASRPSPTLPEVCLVQSVGPASAQGRWWGWFPPVSLLPEPSRGGEGTGLPQSPKTQQRSPDPGEGRRVPRAPPSRQADKWCSSCTPGPARTTRTRFTLST